MRTNFPFKYYRHGLSTSLRVNSPFGHKLLHTCAWFGSISTLNLLLRRGADPRRKNFRHNTPLHLAAFRGHTACLKVNKIYRELSKA